jgi:hypothetical protein
MKGVAQRAGRGVIALSTVIKRPLVCVVCVYTIQRQLLLALH